MAVGLAAAGLVLNACAGPDLLRGPAAVLDEKTIHVVIENPAGSQEKWEVRATGRLVQERREGGPVEIPYLPWPVNAGMIPRTLLAAELGGDGEPLDVLLLGPARERGAVVRARPIGLLRVIDRLERDDKVLAVEEGTPLAKVEDVADLEARFPGVQALLRTWFAQSRRGGGIEVQGYGSRAAAGRLIAEGVRSFEAADAAGDMPDWDRP